MKTIYLATRLYNTADKLRTVRLEEAIQKEIPSAITYLPYRDSDEENIKGDWKSQIFNLDIQNILNADIIMGYWDGPSFDEGIGFELGFALAHNKKNIVIYDDFLHFDFIDETPRFKFNDPLTEILLQIVVHIPFEMTNKENFTNDLIQAQDRIHEQAIDAISASKEPMSISHFNEDNVEVHFETSFSYMCYQWVRDHFPSASYSKRFWQYESKITLKEDLRNAISSDTMYVFSNGMNLPSGTSILCGIRCALGKNTYIISDKNIASLSMTGARMPVNLMIEVGSSGYVSKAELLKGVGVSC